MREFLLFSSIGINGCETIKSWFSDNRNYDIFISIYDERVKEDYIKNFCDYYFYNKGSKHYNMLKLLEIKKNLNYKYIFLIDDDLKLNNIELNLLFKKSDEFKINIAQPSFNKNGLNWKKHLVKKHNGIRLTNYIETGCTIFKHTYFLKYFNFLKQKKIQSNFSWGTDLLFLYLFPDELFYVFDFISVYNPKPKEKIDKFREINKLGSGNNRKEQFFNFIKTNNIELKLPKLIIKQFSVSN